MSGSNVVTSSPGLGGTGDDGRRHEGVLPPHQLFKVLHPDGKKTTVQAKGQMTNRPIAPAPGPAGHHSGPVGTAAPHNIITKVPTALVSGGVEVGHTNATTVNMSALQHVAVSAATTHQQLSIPNPVGLVSSGASIVQPTGLPMQHHVKPLPMQVPMASLIRSAPIPTSQQFTTAQTHAVTATGTPTIPQVHAFQSHVPRGAVQASQLAVSKSTPLATPVVRTGTPNMQITGMASTNPTVQTLQHQLHQPKALQLPVQTAGGATATINRSGSPQVSLPSAEHRLPAAYHRPLMSNQAVTTTPTVQITIQQPRPPGQLLGQAAKGVTSPQITQKQIMSQATVPPMMHSAASTPISTAKIGTALGQPFLSLQRPQGKVIVTQPGTAPIMQSPNIVTATTTPKAYGITVTGALAKAPKIVMTQASSLSTIQNTLPVSLAAHSGLEQSLRVISAGGGATLNLATAAGLPRQKVTMSPHVNVTTALHPTAQPKSVVPAASLTASTHTMSAVQAAAALASTVNTPIPTTIPSIPVAKVQPTRQLPTSQVVSQAAQQVATHVQQTVQQAQQVQTAGVTTLASHPDVMGGVRGDGGLQTALTPTTLPQGSIFLSQAHRGAANTPTTAITMATTHTDGRTTDRPNLPPQLPYAALQQEYYTTVVNYNNYPNLLYQNMQSHPQTFTSIPAAATTIRPAIVPTQPSNLAATFQAAAHGAGVSSTQGVRLSPMMVTVDPNRHTSLIHTQYTATTEARPSTASDNSAAATTSANVLSNTVLTQTTSTIQGPVSQPPLTNNPSASPRPSILRKRTNDGNVALVKKNLMAMGLDTNSPSNDGPHQPAPAISPKPSICDPSRENSQSSTDTASATSSESPPISAQTPELRKEFKQEPMDITENGTTPIGPPSSAGSSLPNSIEASPRKKPRKQLLNANEELKDGTSTDDEADKLANTPPEIKKELEKVEAIKKEEEYVDEDGIRWVAERRRPNMSLLNHYQVTWKARNNHFLKHTDVKPKEERRPTVNELANQKAVMQKASGWKLFHLAAQLEEMMDLEKDMYKKMGEVQEAIAPKHIAKHTMEDDIGMVHELTQGNIQRSQLMIDQLEEAKTSMTKVLEHKNRIMDIINKHHSKRPVKKKERT